MSDRALRKTFQIVKRLDGIGYDLMCLAPGCGYRSLAWDWRRNALWAGYKHAREHHTS